MTRRAWTHIGAGAVLAASATGIGLAALGGPDRDGAAHAAGSSAAPATATVERGDLASLVTVNGTLAYRGDANGEPFAAINRAKGTLTHLPGLGARVRCGSALYRVDDAPVLLLCGPIPAYRALTIGDHGRDVRQLNRNLHALGSDRRAGVTIDPAADRFTWPTQAALERLQRDRGAEPTGKLALGDAVVLPRPARIAVVHGRVGESARVGSSIVEATTDGIAVLVELDATQQGAVHRGDRARITLPGNRAVRGTVASIGRVARIPADAKDDVAAATIPAFITLDQPKRASGLDHAPVRVAIATAGVADALSVPVTALVGRAGGGYAVEVVRDGGRRAQVSVKLGLFDTTAGRVQVEGAGLSPGDRVVVPSS
ncbi:MAG: peptidoglycan-binding protein [Solirubrobacteraceae bacterium]|nr:peptidoglycan-binding protein [Solirubrobacteraceae bacterium]